MVHSTWRKRAWHSSGIPYWLQYILLLKFYMNMLFWYGVSVHPCTEQQWQFVWMYKLVMNTDITCNFLDFGFCRDGQKCCLNSKLLLYICIVCELLAYFCIGSTFYIHINAERWFSGLYFTLSCVVLVLGKAGEGFLIIWQYNVRWFWRILVFSSFKWRVTFRLYCHCQCP